MIAFPDAITSGKPELSKIRFLLFGPPKIGKTTQISGFPNVLFLTTEKGYEAIKIFKTDIKIWQDFKDIVKLIVKGRHKYKTICIDTIDILFSLCEDHVCRKMNIDHPSDSEWGKGWKAVRKEFEDELQKLFMTDYGVIFISHTKETETIVRGGGKTIKTVSTLPNQARLVLLPKVSIIGFMDVMPVEVKPNKFVNKRAITFEPTEEIEAGDRTGLLPPTLVVTKDSVKTYQKFKHYFK